MSSYDSAALTLRLDQTTGDLEIIGKQVVGNHTVQIEDVYKQKIQFGVSVLDATVILSSNTVGLVAGDSAVVAIQDYYVALEPLTQTDSTVATVNLVEEPNPEQANKPKKYIEITGKQSGTTTITVRDAQGNQQLIGVNVTGSTTPIEDAGLIGESQNAKFLAVIYYPRNQTEGADVIEFITEGNIQEVGIDFVRNGQRYYQPLELDASGKYTLACEDCGSDASLPYLIDSAGQKVYAKSIRTRFDTTGVANVEEMEINSTPNATLIADSYSQLGKIQTQPLGQGYLGGINQAIYWFLTSDTNNEWGTTTRAELTKLVTRKTAITSSISLVPEFQAKYDTIETDIANGTHYYNIQDKQWLKGYLAASGVIKSTYSGLSNTRVLNKVTEYHTTKIFVPVNIINLEYTANVDNGYLGGIYFENTSYVKETGYEYYYNAQNYGKISFTDDSKYHSSIIIPDCLDACNLYVRPYVIDVFGTTVYPQEGFVSIKYAGGITETIPQNILGAVDYSTTTVASVEDGVDIAFLPQLLAILTLLDLVSGFSLDDTPTILPVKLPDGVTTAMQSTLKRVLELADDVKVSQLVIRLGRTKDELLATMRTPGGNPLRWGLSAKNTTITGNLTDGLEVDSSKIKSTVGTKFITKFYNDGTWALEQLFKGGIANYDKIGEKFYTSNLLVDQYRYLQKLGLISNSYKVNKITLESVENLDTVTKLKAGQDFSSTTLGKMVTHLTQDLGLSVKEIKIGNFSSVTDGYNTLEFIDRIEIILQ